MYCQGMNTHPAFPRTTRSGYAVSAVGHQSVAYFDDSPIGRTQAYRHHAWLSSYGYVAVVATIDWAAA